MKKFRFALLFALLIALALPATAFAAGLPEDKIVFGGTYTLESGEVLNGNLVVFGGSVTLEEGSTVHGDVVVFGGTLDANGVVTGNVVCIGGLVQLGDSATIQQNVVSLGANLDRSPNAIVMGEVTSGFTGPFLFDIPGIKPDIQPVPNIRVDINPFVTFMWIVLRTLLWAALAVILVLLLPHSIERIGNAAARQPLISGGLGLLTMVLAPIVLLILTITICLIPVALLGVLLLVVAWGFGLIALGFEIGKRLADRLNQDWSPALSAGLGTLLLIFVLDGLREIIPCVGWMFPAIAGLVGLGAVILTRFGTQIYPLMPPPPPPNAAWTAPLPEPPISPPGQPLPPEVTRDDTSRTEEEELPPVV